MSYLFNNIADDLLINRSATLTEWTYLVWLYPTTIQELLILIWAQGAANKLFIQTRFDNTDEIGVTVRTSGTESWRGTTDIGLQADAHRFIVATYSNANKIKIYHGNLATPAVEASYTAADPGTGTMSAINADMEVCNGWGGDARYMQGEISMVHFVDSELSLGEIQRQQFRPYPLPGTFFYCWPGLHGISSCPDLSGNGNNLSPANVSLGVNPAPLGPPFGFDFPAPPMGLPGSVLYGHDTGVLEDRTRNLVDGALVGASILGSADDERISINAGDTWTSKPEYVGLGSKEILTDQYQTGSGTIAVYYRTGATQGACEAAGWTAYTGAFTSLGWMQVQVRG